MKKLFKKGFTLVELVVTVAIIAILSGIAVLSYSGIQDRAKKSADSAIISQLNTQLALKQETEGNNKTCYDAVMDAAEIGFDMEKLTPSTSGCIYVWDQDNDRFAVLDNDMKVFSEDNAYQLTNVISHRWLFVTSISQTNYGQYLVEGSTETEFTVKGGLDLGKNINTKSVTYLHNEESNVQNIVIRTNSYDTDIIVNAPYDSVSHYNLANEVDVISVAPHSYHENGSILSNINLKDGRVVMEEGATANAIYVDATASDITTGTVAVAADNDKTPTVPVIVRDDVKEAADTKGGNNSIPDPQVENVIVLGDKVLDDQGAETSIDAEAYVISEKKNYATFAEALDAMTANDTVILLKDIEDVSHINIDKSVDGTYKIDLNGHSVKFTSTGVAKNEMALVIEGEGTYTLCNGTLTTDTYEYGDVMDLWVPITLNNIRVNYNDPIVDGYARWGAIYYGGPLLTMNSCYINAISGPGFQNGEESAKAILNNTTIVAPDHSALYCGGGSITEVNDCTISGKRAIHACTSGAMYTINGGTFTGTDYSIQLDNTTKAVDYLGDGNYVGGSFALVYGGTFVGPVKVQASNGGVAALYIYGGTFDTDVSTYRK